MKDPLFSRSAVQIGIGCQRFVGRGWLRFAGGALLSSGLSRLLLRVGESGFDRGD